MASLDQRLADLIAALGADFKLTRAMLGSLSGLTTNEKNSLVGAINEVRATALSNSGGGGSTSPPPLSANLMLSGMKAQTTADLSMMTNNQLTLFNNNTPYIIKMWTPVAITVTQIAFPLTGTAASLANWFSALYDATGALIPNTTSADLSTTLTASAPIFYSINPTTTPVSIPAGFFYISFKMGTATTYPKTYQTAAVSPNSFLFSGNPAVPETCYRIGFGSNTWTGGSPPATIGTVTSDYRGLVLGIR